MMRNYFLAFVPMFVAVDALGMVPIFLSLTSGMSRYERQRLVQRSIITALVVAMAFLWVGRWMFSLLGITMNDFLIAGGAILFILSIRDLLSVSKSSALPESTMGVVPLAVPLIVGPAVLTTSLILHSTFGLLPTFFSIVANIVLCGIILQCAGAFSKLLGETGAHTLSKIFSLLLAAIGVMLVRRGLLSILGA